jgi:hypothetical protein
MLDYRNGGYDPMSIVNKIVDIDIRVKNLLRLKILLK